MRLEMGDAIRLFLHQVVCAQALPFPLKDAGRSSRIGQAALGYEASRTSQGPCCGQERCVADGCASLAATAASQARSLTRQLRT